jgi:hypothetical protein
MLGKMKVALQLSFPNRKTSIRHKIAFVTRAVLKIINEQ